MKQRNLWPWAIIGFFVVFIGAAVSFIVFAMGQEMDLVREDYYAEELRHQQRIEATQRALKLGEQASLHLRAQALEVQVPGAHAAGGAAGVVEFYRPADKAQDRRLPMELDPSGFQRIDVSSLRAGPWLVRAEWSVSGQRHLMELRMVLPGAGVQGPGRL